MLEKYLQEIGLSESEAKVYVALLQVDNDSVLDLSKKTGINRTTVYLILESLAKKGLIGEMKVDKKVRYQAESPERLVTYTDNQKAILEERSKRLMDIVPQLKSIQRDSGERPVVKYFEGREGIISSLESLFSDNDFGGTIHMVYPKDEFEGLFTEKEMEKYRAIRIKKDIKSKSLYTTRKAPRISDATGNRIQIDGGKYPITCDINIYKDKIRISTLGKSLSGIFIVSQDLADTLRSLIDLIFDKNEESQSK